MSSLFKKLLPALGIATLTFSSCLFSEEGMNKTHDKSMHRSQNMQQQQMMQDECPTDFYLSADFIYWTVREDGLEFAMTGSGSTTVTTGKGSVYNVGEKYEPGFKVGAGVTFDHDKWDLAAEYIWLHSSESQTRNNTAADTSTLMVPLWEVAGVTTGDTLTKAVANWKVRYNDIHLELGKMLCLSPRLKLRVHGGLQGSWIDQNYDVDYTRATSGNLDKMRQKQNYWGIGLRGGMQTSWYFVDSFSLFADVSLAGLWSELKLDRKDTSTTTADVTTTTLNTGVSVWTLEPVINLMAGFRWQTCFCDAYKFMIQAGWELNAWVNHNNFLQHVAMDGHNGDLNLQGLSLKIRFDF